MIRIDMIYRYYQPISPIPKLQKGFGGIFTEMNVRNRRKINEDERGRERGGEERKREREADKIRQKKLGCGLAKG